MTQPRSLPLTVLMTMMLGGGCSGVDPGQVSSDSDSPAMADGDDPDSWGSYYCVESGRTTVDVDDAGATADGFDLSAADAIDDYARLWFGSWWEGALSDREPEGPATVAMSWDGGVIEAITYLMYREEGGGPVGEGVVSEHCDSEYHIEMVLAVETSDSLLAESTGITLVAASIFASFLEYVEESSVLGQTHPSTAGAPGTKLVLGGTGASDQLNIQVFWDEEESNSPVGTMHLSPE